MNSVTKSVGQRLPYTKHTAGKFSSVPVNSGLLYYGTPYVPNLVNHGGKMAKRTYKALLVAPDGEWVTDYHGCSTVEEVVEKLADQGSRWFFYPFQFVITNNVISGAETFRHNKIIDAAFPFEHYKGWTIRHAIEQLKRDAINYA